MLLLFFITSFHTPAKINRFETDTSFVELIFKFIKYKFAQRIPLRVHIRERAGDEDGAGGPDEVLWHIGFKFA